jgi:hypothetical protein
MTATFSLIRFQDELAAKIVTLWAGPRNKARRAVEGSMKRAAVRRLEKFGFTHRQAWDAVQDACDVAELKLDCEYR